MTTISPAGNNPKTHTADQPVNSLMQQFSKHKAKGFTLIEVLVAIAIVAIGLAAVFCSFISSYQILKQTENYNQAILISLEQLWQMEDKALRGEDISGLYHGEHTDGLKKFEWEFSDDAIEPYEDLKELKLNIKWTEGKRKGQINWASYLIKEE